MRRLSTLKPASASVWIAGLLLHLSSRRVVLAQILEFDEVPVPSKQSLNTIYVFFVDSFKDAPDTSLGQPIIKIQDMTAEPIYTTMKKDAQELSNYMGLQLTFLRYADFWKRITPMKMCSTREDVAAGTSQVANQLYVRPEPGKSQDELNVYSYTISFRNSSKPQDNTFVVTSTGIYVLIFSNCGEESEATVSGTVTVRNAYGFLPANEYPLMPFYGWLLLAYTVLAVAWVARSIRWWSQLFRIQHCITVVVLFGMLECFLWSVYFRSWNASGARTNRNTGLFVAATISTVVKSTFSYMIVLVAALGWGVTRPYLDRCTRIKVITLCVMYIGLDSVREVVLSFRHSRALSLTFVLLCLLPVSLLNGAIFFWIFSALSKLMQTLREQQQLEKLVLFQRLLIILTTAIVIATLTILFELYDLSRSLSFSWRYQWLLTDGISHLLFLFVLAAMMYLWAPHESSQRLCFSEQLGTNEDDRASCRRSPETGIEEGIEGDEDADDSAPKPTVVGTKI